MTPFVPALLAKLTLILALGLIVNSGLRSFSPSLRHLVLFATLGSCLALPFAMLMEPQWSVALLPRSSPAILYSGSGHTAGSRVDGSRPSAFASSPAQGSATNARPLNNTLTAKVIGARADQIVRDARGGPLLGILWLLGSVAVIAWLVIGRFRLRRIAATSWPLNGFDWNGILEEERKYAGVTKPVLLYSSSVVSTPLTWGVRAPVVLLPEDALDWPEAHRRIVLRHELAHVARGDSFNQLVAGFVCALYWFHPLTWMTERRLRAECERACDDSVVSLGTPAAEYAAHLLEVARSARAFGAPGFLSVAMARPSQLEGRLLAVLNESRRRISLSRGARPAAALLSALVLIPLAAFRPVPRAEAAAKGGLRTSGSNDSAERVNRTKSTQSVSVTSSSPAAVIEASSLTVGRMLGNNRRAAADTTFQLSVPARSAGTLTLNLTTGGEVVLTGSDKPEVVVRASLGGRDWRETEVTLQPSDGNARLESRYTGNARNQSSHHVFEITIPRNYNVRISSAGGSLSIKGVNGSFTGQTGGGEINIERSNGEAEIQTGGGDIRVSDSRLNGTVRTGGGVVRIEGVTGHLSGYSGSGPVTVTRSDGVNVVGGRAGENSFSITSGSGSRAGSGTTIDIKDGVAQASSFAASGIRMSSAGGAILLPSAPEGARVVTGGGPIRIGPSGGEVYAQTGGGPIDIGPATGSVEAHTGAGDVTIELKGAGSHSVDVTSGKGQVVLILPRDLDATVELETAYTNNLGHKTRIVSDWPLPTTESANRDTSEGTPRRYIRARQTFGRGGGVIRVRTVNGDVVLHRS